MPMMGETNREYAPSGAQNPPLSHVVPPSNVSTTAATPAAKSAFEISPARQNPNAPDMISMALGNELNTTQAHTKSFRPDVSGPFPEPAIEYARAAPTVMSKRNNPPSVALEAVAAAPQPSCPASAKVVLSAAANHRRLRIDRPKNTAAIRIRVLSPL